MLGGADVRGALSLSRLPVRLWRGLFHHRRVPTDALNLTGELNGFTVDTDSGNQVTRKFCPTCGSPILSELSANAAMTVLKAATLDDPGWLKPAVHIWTASGQPWAETSAEMPKFDRNPG